MKRHLVKRRLVGLLVLAFAIWPLLQYQLVRHYGVDPWKLFGWAMYARPHGMATVRVFQISRDGSHRLLDFRSYTPEEERAVAAFRHRRVVLGELEEMDAVGAKWLALHPEFEGVLIGVLRLDLDPSSARLTLDRAAETFWRDGRDEPFPLPPPLQPPLPDA